MASKPPKVGKDGVELSDLSKSSKVGAPPPLPVGRPDPISPGSVIEAGGPVKKPAEDKKPPSSPPNAKKPEEKKMDTGGGNSFAEIMTQLVRQMWENKLDPIGDFLWKHVVGPPVRAVGRALVAAGHWLTDPITSRLERAGNWWKNLFGEGSKPTPSAPDASKTPSDAAPPVAPGASSAAPGASSAAPGASSAAPVASSAAPVASSVAPVASPAAASVDAPAPSVLSPLSSSAGAGGSHKDMAAAASVAPQPAPGSDLGAMASASAKSASEHDAHDAPAPP